MEMRKKEGGDLHVATEKEGVKFAEALPPTQVEPETKKEETTTGKIL